MTVTTCNMTTQGYRQYLQWILPIPPVDITIMLINTNLKAIASCNKVKNLVSHKATTLCI